jgi:hypothetical protein
MTFRLLAFALLLGPAAAAQGFLKFEKRVFKMGVNFVDVTPSTGPGVVPYPPLPRPPKPTFNLGFAADFRLLRSPLALRVGGQYQPRGYWLTTTLLRTGDRVRVNSSLHYLDVPVDLVLTVGGERMKLYASAGAYVGYGIYGRRTHRGDSAIFRSPGDTVRQSVQRVNAFGSNALNRLDYGLNFAIGFERNDFQFGITYGHGLANASNVPRQPLYHRSLGLFLAYRFDGM